MSRIGRQPITVPAGVDVKLVGNHIAVKGPKGELTRDLHPDMIIKHEGDTILVERSSDLGFQRGLHGLTRTLISNMIIGVTAGYERALDIVGVGYKALQKGNDIEVIVGYSHSVMVTPPAGITVDIPNPNRLVVKGFDKELVGQVAANIRKIRKPEPYKGKGIRYSDEVVRRKVGKTGK